MLIHRIFLLALPLALAGCVAKLPIDQPPVAMGFANAAQQEGVTGIETTTVRVRVNEDGERTEITGVPCRIDGPGYSSAFMAPAVVQLPLFGNEAPQLALACTFEGETRTRTLTARNVSEEARQASRERLLDNLRDGDGSGLSVGIAIDLGSSSRRGFDDFDYADSVFTFRR